MENFRPKFKQIIENLQEKLHQGESKQSETAKICVSIRWKSDGEKCSKTLCKIFERKNKQNSTDAKHSSNPDNIFESAKKLLRKLNPNKSSSKTARSKVLSKLPNRKKQQQKQQTQNF